MKTAPAVFSAILGIASVLGRQGFADPGSGERQRIWVASWTTPISGVLTKTDFAGLSQETIVILRQLPEFQQPEFDALPGGEASDQTFRMIVKPDLWGNTVRVHFSNAFGTHDISLSAAAVGLKESGANLVQGTNARITFGRKSEALIPRGGEVLSDPVHLRFVTKGNRRWLGGRELAVSFTVIGRSGLLSSHDARVSSYIARPNSGDHSGDEDGSAFPYVTNSFILVKELDVLADPDTAVVCALGDSITDGGTPIGMTINGYDSWPDALSVRAHKIYGDKVSVVNMGVGGNTVVAVLDAPGTTDPVVQRLNRDVLSIAGLTSVVWLEGINDLGAGQSKPEPIIEGYKRVIARLHARGVKVIGATLTPSIRPEPYDEGTPAAARAFWDKYGNTQTNAYRKEVNQFIRTSGLFDSVADMEKVTEDPSTGAFYRHFQDGDYLHPNRAGHQAMAEAVDLNALVSPRASHSNN
jgi:lysophospholipase L1-like esterase